MDPMVKTNAATDAGEALSAPLGDMIAAIGRGVADAQRAMDAQTLTTFKLLYAGDEEGLDELRRLGYQPTWYRIPELEADVTLSLSISATSTEEGKRAASPDAPVGGPGRIKLYAVPVDASYANKYEFQVNAASHLKFKIVAVPPSPQVAELKVVPGLGNKTFAEARDLLEELAIPYRLKDPKIVPAPDARVRSFTPRVGTVLARGQAVILNV